MYDALLLLSSCAVSLGSDPGLLNAGELCDEERASNQEDGEAVVMLSMLALSRDMRLLRTAAGLGRGRC